MVQGHGRRRIGWPGRWPGDIVAGPGARAFTLIELLVVVAIIALLVSILLPALAQARALTNTSVCMAHLKSTGSAFSMYQAERRGLLPDLYAKDLGRGDHWERSWWTTLTVAGYLSSAEFIRCPQFDESSALTPSVAVVDIDLDDEGWANWFTIYTSTYGYVYSWLDAGTKKTRPISWSNTMANDEMIDVDKAILSTSSESYLFDNCELEGYPTGVTYDEWIAMMPSDYADPAGFRAYEHTTGSIGNVTGDMRWYNISLRHGRSLNALFFDGHVEKIAGPRFWQSRSNWNDAGSPDCPWDGY